MNFNNVEKIEGKREAFMKTIFVYFSLEGNTDHVASKMNECSGCDVLKIEVVKPYEFDASGYDLIIFGTRVWARDFAPPLKIFIRQNQDGLKGKRFAVYTGYRGSGCEKAARKLADFIGVENFEKQLQLVEPRARQSEKKDVMIKEFCKSLGMC